MAGYIIYSLDWGKFQKFVERPMPGQLAAFASRLCDGLEEHEFDEGDPVLTWPTNPKAAGARRRQTLGAAGLVRRLVRNGKGSLGGRHFRRVYG